MYPCGEVVGSHAIPATVCHVAMTPTTNDVASVIDFSVLVTLDPQISAVSIRDALVVAQSRPEPAPPTIESFVLLSHARAEAWRQLRARGLHADTEPTVQVDADPLEALSPMERTVLYLSMRRDFKYEDIAYITDLSVKQVKKMRKRAAVSFIRAVTSLALAMDLTPCPVRDRIAAQGAGMLTRKDIDALTLHAAECSICVAWLRRADEHAVKGYAFLAAPDSQQVEAVLASLVHVSDEERDRIVKRAGRLRSDGRPPRAEWWDRNPKLLIRRSIAFGIASVALLLTGLFLLG